MPTHDTSRITFHASRTEWLILGGILVLSLFLRLFWLDRVPPGVRYDELLDVQMAERVMAGERPIYFAESWGHEPLYHYLQAISLSILGKTIYGSRAISVLSGTLSVLTTWLIARRLFGPAIGLLAAGLLAVSFWSLMLSRFGLRIVGVAPWMGLAAYTFWRGLETPHPCDGSDKSQIRKPLQGWISGRIPICWFALCGLCQAAMLYTYFAGWMSLAILGAFTVYMALFHRATLKGRWPGLLLSFALPLVLATPMVLYVLRHPVVGQRVGQVGSVIATAWQTHDLRPLLDNAGETLLMFSIKADQEWLYNLAGRPVFDPLTALLFYAGLLLTLWRWRDPKHAFALLWLALGIAPTLITWPAGSLPHSVMAMSPTFILVALAVLTAWKWAVKRPQQMIRWGIHALIVGVILLFSLSSGYDYFVRWSRAEQVRHEYQAPVAAVARYLQQSNDTTPVAISAPFVDFWNPWSQQSFNLLFQRKDISIRWFNGASSVLIPAGEETRFFLPDHIRYPSQIDQELKTLLMAGAVPIEIGHRDQVGNTFDLYRLQDRAPLEQFLVSCAAASTWSSAEGPYTAGESEKQRQSLSLPLNLGDRLSLLGYIYSQEQTAPGAIWRLTTCWRVLSDEAEPLAIFIHVLDDANIVRASRDELGVSTAGWRQGDILIHIHQLSMPGNMLPSIQRVELGVYSPQTLIRLDIRAQDTTQPVPYSRVLLKPLHIE